MIQKDYVVVQLLMHYASSARDVPKSYKNLNFKVGFVVFSIGLVYTE